MISRTLFDGFLRPYYEQVIPHIKSRGCKVFVDTDGDVSDAMAWYQDVGVEGFLPLERNSGVDVVSLRERFPRMGFLGAFDKLAMSKGEESIRAEFDRLLPVMRGGGFIVGCDHQTPPGVSYADYLLFLRIFREYAERAGTRL
jgi:uroporphyrinogen-III decarboxylase